LQKSTGGQGTGQAGLESGWRYVDAKAAGHDLTQHGDHIQKSLGPNAAPDLAWPAPAMNF